jgi:aryl-alcohol dehydrogenase-like predicted oxidoreductase
MKHISIGGLDVSRIGLGAMSMSGYYNIGAGSDAESIRTIHRALDLGVTHLDTAEIYGPYTNEELVGRAIGRHSGTDRSGVAARAGRRHRPDSRHQAGRPCRGEHSRRRHRAERRASRTAEQPDAGRGRAS